MGSLPLTWEGIALPELISSYSPRIRGRRCPSIVLHRTVRDSDERSGDTKGWNSCLEVAVVRCGSLKALLWGSVVFLPSVTHQHAAEKSPGLPHRL